MNFGLSIVGYSKTGLIPIISTKLPFLDPTPSLDTFLYRFSTPIGILLGQGDQYYTGMYGPYPVSNHNDYHAFSYSFFLPDTILGTPRDDLNAFLIAILFIPRKSRFDTPYTEEFLNDYIKKFIDLNDLISKENFESFFNSLSKAMFYDEKKQKIEDITLTTIMPKPVVQEKNNNSVYIELETEPESIIAVPWILHAVYHGLEQATHDILGESSSILDILMEQYTAEILDRFHLFDDIFAKETPSITDAIQLGVDHLARVGEIVNVKPLGNNQFECSINCSFSDAVHPYLPIDKCLWMRYLSAIVRRILPPDKDLHMKRSEFDPKIGSKTILEIVPKVFKTV